MNILLKIHSGKGVVDTVRVPVKGDGVTVIQQPKQKVNYELVDSDTNAGPERIFAERKGNDLHIAFEKDQAADLVIKDYYASDELSPVIGLGQDGQYYGYIAETGIEGEYIAYLNENVLAAEVLGGKAILAAAAPINWLHVLGGVAGAGLLAALAGGGSGGGSGSAAASAAPPAAPNVKANRDGTVEFNTDPAVNRYEVDVIPEGKKHPVKVVLEKQPDGSLKSSRPDLIPDVPAGSPKVVIPADSVKDGSKVNVVAVGDGGKSSGNADAVYDGDSDKPAGIQADLIDRNNDGKPDLVHLKGKAKPNAAVVVTDKEGNPIAETQADENGDWTVPVVLDPKNPSRDGVDDLGVVAKEPGKNPSEPAKVDPANVQGSKQQPNDTYVEPPVLTPGQPAGDGKVPVKVQPPKDAEKVTIVVIKPDGSKAEIEAEKDPEGKFKLSDNPNNPEGVEVVPGDDGSFTVKVPEATAPADSKIVGKSENSAGDESKPSAPVKVDENKQPVAVDENTLEQTGKPTINPTSPKSIDESPEADNNPETVLIKGTAAPNSSVTAYVEKDGNKVPVGSVTADASGAFEMKISDLDKTVDIKEGDKISVTAKEEGKKESEHSDAVTVPPVEAGKDGHPYDTQKPGAEISIDTPADGSASVTVKKLKPNEKVDISINNGDKTLKFVADENGNLKKDPAAPADALYDEIKIEGNKVIFPKDKLLDGSTIAAVASDLAGNVGEQAQGKVGFDNPSEKPTSVKVTPIDTDVVNDNIPEVAKVELEGGDVKPGSVLTLRDENGNEIAKITLTPEHFQNGKAVVTVPLNKEAPLPKVIKATVQAPGKGESEPAEAKVPDLADSTGLSKEEVQARHPNDKSVEAPTVVATPEGVKVKIDPKDTQTFTVKIEESGKPAEEVVYTKQPDGSFKPNKPAYPTLAKGEDTLLIPRDKLPKGPVDVSAEATDAIGHTAGSTKVPVDPILEQTKAPTVESVVAKNTGAAKDNNPEEFTLKGKAEPNAEVIAKDKDGNELGRAKADENGDYTLIAKEKGTDITDSSEITLQAVAPNKRLSEKTPAPSNKGELTHPNVIEAPQAPETPAPENPAPEAAKPLEKPTDLKLVATDTREGGDNRTEANPDNFVLTGTVPNAPAGTLVKVSVDGVVVGTGKTDASGKFTVEFNDTGKTKADGSPLDIQKDSKLTVEAVHPTDPSKNSPAAEKNVDEADIVRADQSAPGVNIAPTPEGVVVELDPQPKPGDSTKVSVEKDGVKTEHTYTADENGNWQPTSPNAPAVNPDGTVNIPAPGGSTVSAETADTAGNTNKPQPKPNAPADSLPTNTVKVPETAAADTVEPKKTATPTAEITKVIDADSPADGKADQYEVSGTVAGEPEGTPVKVYDEAGNLLGEGKTKPDGKFVINPVAKPKVGDKLLVKAENPAKTPSDVAELPTSDNGADKPVSEYLDKTPPATPIVTPNPVKGSVDVSLDPDAVAGNTLKITLTPEGSDTPVDVTLTKQPDGSWKSDKPNLVPDAIDGQPKVTIPEDVVKDNTDVSAQNTDNAGNKSPEPSKENGAQATARADSETATPVIESVKGFDLNEKADVNPDKAVIKGKVTGEPVGTVVTIFDKDGKEIATVQTKDADGNFEAVIVEKSAKDNLKAGASAEVDEINAGDSYTAKAKANGKSSSPASNSVEIEAITGGNAEQHPGDAGNPTAPTVTPSTETTKEKGKGSVTVGFPSDAVAGDEVAVEFIPEQTGEPKADNTANTPVTVVYTKQPDGTWAPKDADNAAKASTNGLPQPAGDNLTLPGDSLKDAQPVKATATDVAGKKSPETTAVAGFDDPVQTPVLKEGFPKVQNVDGTPENSTPNKAVLEGTTSPNVKLVLKDKDGNPIALNPEVRSDDQGNFTIELTNPADLAKAPFKLEAERTEGTHTEKSGESAPITLPEAVPAGTPVANAGDEATPSTDKGGYPNDNTPPPAPTINVGTDGSADVNIDLPTDLKNGEKVTITYMGSDDQPKTVVATKGESGWTLDPATPAEVVNGTNTTDPVKVKIPAASVKDNTEVSARSQDLAGNLSEKAKGTTKYDSVTAKPTIEVKAIDTAEKADNQIDALIVTGTVNGESTAGVGIYHGDTKLVDEGSSFTTDAQGNYKFILTKNGADVEKLKQKYPDHTVITVTADLPAAGEKLTAKAKKAGKGVSPVSEEAAIPALTATTDDHPFDEGITAPTLKAYGEADGVDKQGDVEVNLPEDAVEGDSVTVTITPPADSTGTQPAATTITLTKGANGWTASPELTEGQTLAGDKLTIESTAIADGSTVSAAGTDLAGRTSAGTEVDGTANSVTAQTDPRQTGTPSVTVKAEDTEATANNTAEKVTISGTLSDSRDHTAVVSLFNANGEVVAKATAVNGAYTFTLTKGDAATATGDAAPTDGNATLTDLALTGFKVKAKAEGASISEQAEVTVPAVTEQTALESLALSGTVTGYASQALEVYKGTEKIADATTNADGSFTINPEKAKLPTADKLHEISVKKADGTVVDFSGTAVRASEGSQHTGDAAAPEFTHTFTAKLANRPITVNKGTGTGTAAFDTAETKANGLELTLPNTPAEGDVLHLIEKTANNATKETAYEFKNGAWTAKDGKNELQLTNAPEAAAGSKVTIPVTAETGNSYSVVYRDLAGNAKVATAAVSEQFDATPDVVDEPVMKLGGKTKESGKGSDMLVTNFQEGETGKPKAVNAGDVHIRPGADNKKLEVSFVPADAVNNAGTAGGTGTASGGTGAADEAQAITLYGELNPQTGKFEFYTDANKGTKADYVSETLGQDGYTYYTVPAAKVANGSLVSVVGVNGNNVRSDDADRTKVTPATESTTGATNTSESAKDSASGISRFDDKTDTAVGTPTVEQADANANIVITPTAAQDSDGSDANNSDNADANKLAVEFDPSHLSAETAANYGLNVTQPANGQAASTDNQQILVAYKKADGKWALGKTAVKTFDEALALTAEELEPVSEQVATIDAASGAITLKKDVVNGKDQNGSGASTVKAKAQDPYGNTADGSKVVEHSDPVKPLITTEAPYIGSPRAGVVTITPKPDHDTVEITGFNGKTITVTKSGNPEELSPYSISPENTAGVSFDPETGMVTITNPNPSSPITITATGKVNEKNGNNAASASIEHTLPAVQGEDRDNDINDGVDAIELISALANGDVVFKPGADNTELTVSYTKTDGTQQTATLKRQPNGDWKKADGTELPDGLTFSNGEFKFPAASLKDFSEVKVKGKDAHDNENSEVRAVAKPDDSSTDTADAPTLSTTPETAATGKGNVTINKGNDNVKFEVEYTPSEQNATATKLTAKFDEAESKWTLLDSEGVPVDSDIATIDESSGSVTLKRGALKDGSQVTAKGYDTYGNEANGNTETVSSKVPAGAEGVPGGGAASGESSAEGGQEGNYEGATYFGGQGAFKVSQSDPANDDNNVEISVGMNQYNGHDTYLAQKYHAVVRVVHEGKEMDLVLEGGKGRTVHAALLDPNGADYNSQKVSGQFDNLYNRGMGSGNTGSSSVKAVYKFGNTSYKDVEVRLSNMTTKAYKNLTESEKKGSFASTPDGTALFNYLKMVDDLSQVVKSTETKVVNYTVPGPGGVGVVASYPSQVTKIQSSKTSAIKLYADTVEPANNDSTNPKLRFDLFSQTGANVATDRDGTPTIYLKNYIESKNVKLEKTPAPTLTPENDGSMTIVPKAEHNEISLKYVDENNSPRTALLKKDASGSWTVHRGKADHFDLTNGIKIKADALKDNLTDSVAAKAKQPIVNDTFYKFSDVVKATPSADPAPPAPPAKPKNLEDLATRLINIATDADNPQKDAVVKGGNDVERFKLPLRDIVGKGASDLAAFVKSKGGTHNWDKNNFVDKYTFREGDNTNYGIKINGSMGASTQYSLYRPSGVELTLKGGDDIVLLQNHLGSQYAHRPSKVDLGEGHNILVVGTSNNEVYLYVNKNKPDEPFKFVKRTEQAPSGYTKVEGVDVERGERDRDDGQFYKGGRIKNAEVKGGSGDDVVLVEGGRFNDESAIDAHAVIDLGAGNDALIIAPNEELSRAQSNAGSIGNKQSGKDPIVKMGEGDDYLKAVGIAHGGKVYMGEGNDKVELNRFRESDSVLDMGAGDDSVKIHGEVHGGGSILLGAGNDTIDFKVTTNLWNERGNEVRFGAKLDGGEGYDTFILRKPSEIGNAVFKAQHLTHLASKDFKNIEEIKMEKGTAVDISVADLLQGNTRVLKLTAEGDKSPGFTEQKDARLVDLGATNFNDGSVNKPVLKNTVLLPTDQSADKFVDRIEGNVKWAKTGTQTEGAITYDVYRAGSYDREVWIEQNAFVII